MHPEVRDENEVKQLQEMARLGARRCLRCQFIIVKEGGCNHVHCEQCRFDFMWSEAEQVIAPIESYTPAPVVDSADATFQGWGQLRKAQQEYIDKNGITDTPFEIGEVAPSQADSIFYFDHETALWSPDICELESIASRQAG